MEPISPLPVNLLAVLRDSLAVLPNSPPGRLAPPCPRGSPALPLAPDARQASLTSRSSAAALRKRKRVRAGPRDQSAASTMSAPSAGLADCPFFSNVAEQRLGLWTTHSFSKGWITHSTSKGWIGISWALRRASSCATLWHASRCAIFTTSAGVRLPGWSLRESSSVRLEPAVTMGDPGLSHAVSSAQGHGQDSADRPPPGY